MSYTIEQLLSLSVRDQCIKSTYDSILVVPTGKKSETGYMLMAIVGMKDRWDLVEIAGYCETILWKVSEFIHPNIENLRSDMDAETGVMHYFTEGRFEVSAIFSDIAYVSVDNMKKSLENAKNEYNSPQEEGQIIGLTGVYWFIGIWFLIIFLMIGILFAQS